ncbi:nucleotidyltransferase domain-containing protein [Heliorestis acidaminivorans]|uniref:Nucleotidyltransferase domain-containing protein n=1 Tax=Heliorestis acidaminivorans TaxID=553427 RepID=A0A6I0F6H1_9FIRM|nr:nucleotidyltransferase domain-containing protein [Heliorestis acidaminivorans]KAB2952962.1 nucleotidyltransferase domain-containing protein [Heliorestis acidaminivorans]
MKYGLKDSVLESMLNIFSRHPNIERVVLYGSRAKGNYRNGSDIDLTLLGKKLDIRELNRISLELDELYLPYDIDLSIFEKIENQDLVEHIQRIGITIYKK